MAKGLWPVLNVANIEKSTEFYKALGFRTKIEEAPGMRWGNLDLGNTGLVFWPKDNVAPGQPADTQAWLSGELGKGVMFTLGVPNAEKTWEKVKSQRFHVDSPLRNQEWGGREFTLVDPDGYVVNITDKFPGAPPKKASARKVKAKPKTKAKKTTTTKRR